MPLTVKVERLRADAVARPLDGFGQERGRDLRRRGDARPLARQVDGHVQDARHGADRPLDPRGARGAGHALDRQGDDARPRRRPSRGCSGGPDRAGPWAVCLRPTSTFGRMSGFQRWQGQGPFTWASSRGLPTPAAPDRRKAVTEPGTAGRPPPGMPVSRETIPKGRSRPATAASCRAGHDDRRGDRAATRPRMPRRQRRHRCLRVARAGRNVSDRRRSSPIRDGLAVARQASRPAGSTVGALVEAGDENRAAIPVA